jgi:c(7)-type cytochrome triheme protein
VLVAGHGACTSCHADEFGKRDPRICFACHNAIEPWRPLVADRRPPERTEFGARLDHTTHRGACTGCHTLATGIVQLRPPRGHRACSAAGCHAVEGGPAPQLRTCEGCHQLGIANARIAQRLAAPWSVRARFDHAVHRLGEGGTEVACTRCHDDLAGASLTAIPAPRKQSCVPCHDGETAFSLTGTGCALCHQGRSR